VNTDVRTVAAYTVSEAARHLRLSAGTLRAWVAGRPYPTSAGERRSARLIHPAQAEPPMLSFWNLVEAHVLRALRTEHGVSAPALRKALRYAEKELGIERLLLRPDLQTEAGRVFLERYGQLIDLSNSGQLAMKKTLEAHLRRMEWDPNRLPVLLYPFLPGSQGDGERSIAIDPRVAFGRPIVQRAGVSTQAIVQRLDVGESVSEIADDYGLTPAEIEQAALFERAA
jgi:uncharacterized protein (DUF433 family)